MTSRRIDDSKQSSAGPSSQVIKNDYCLVFSKEFTTQLAQAVKEDLIYHKFNVDIRKEGEGVNTSNTLLTLLQDEAHPLLFIQLKEQAKLYAEAERQKVLNDRKSGNVAKEEEKNKQRQEQKSFLAKRIIVAERKKQFRVSYS